MYCCLICKKEFVPRDLKRPSRTCSKECKNKLARNITIQQFSDPAAREIQRQKSLNQKKIQHINKNMPIQLLREHRGGRIKDTQE